MPNDRPPSPFDDDPLRRLLAIMDRLRDPEHGCPWDLEQDFASIAPHTIEEAYEVADAIDSASMADLRDELGDLLFQVVFHSRMAAEIGAFDFDDVVRTIADKMIARHPHIFGPVTVESADAMSGLWERLKEAERQEKAPDGQARVLDGVTKGLPALTRAVKLQKRAARVGFDWDTAPPILEKLREELNELCDAVEAGSVDASAEEIGDLLFTIANLGRHLDIDPEAALRGANAKFERRFNYIEDCLAQIGLTPLEVDLETMDEYWNQARAHDKSGITD